MRNIALLTLVILLSGCTISARNHYFELENSSSEDYDDFNNIWCFTASESSSVQICSGAYSSKSKYIGVILPIIPQTDRKSRLAYDIKRERIVEFKNLDNSSTVILSDLEGIRLCAGQYSKECDSADSITVKPSSSAWLKVPAGESHQFLVSLAALKFKAKLKQFSESRWHLVSV